MGVPDKYFYSTSAEMKWTVSKDRLREAQTTIAGNRNMLIETLLHKHEYNKLFTVTCTVNEDNEKDYDACYTVCNDEGVLLVYLEEKTVVEDYGTLVNVSCRHKGYVRKPVDDSKRQINVLQEAYDRCMKYPGYKVILAYPAEILAVLEGIRPLCRLMSKDPDLWLSWVFNYNVMDFDNGSQIRFIDKHHNYLNELGGLEAHMINIEYAPEFNIYDFMFFESMLRGNHADEYPFNLYLNGMEYREKIKEYKLDPL